MPTEGSTQVLSIRPLPRLTLEHRRAQMAAFGLMGTVLLVAVFTGGAMLVGAQRLWPFTAVPAILLLPGLFWRTWSELEISVWNKGVRMTARILRAYVLRVCYFTLFWPLSLTGSYLQIARREGETSRWMTRKSRSPHDHQSVIGLRPIMWLLAVVRDEYQESAPPSGTYTLY